jgi:hypothetical protein
MTTQGIYGTYELALADAAIWNKAARCGIAGPRETRRFRYYALRAMAAAIELSAQ